MNREETLIALAEARPLLFGVAKAADPIMVYWKGKMWFGEAVDPTNDLNACAVLEKTLTKKQQVEYKEWVWQLNSERFGTVHLRLLFSTAQQRCEAFLRTLKLWRK